ncbi:unnamed protein product [Ilex paraguariensis]|uniref:Vacuolar protein sorting-associated protein 54 C-terminal domain-containing protein n=1 Tax=Ilex paraguariensis TaxID=185542 RepID=A0ABC8TDC4_9AQUA
MFVSMSIGYGGFRNVGFEDCPQNLVSGLKSITAKHLALASQVISFTYVVIPELRRVLFLKVPDSRKGLLLLEMDRLAQDL